MGSGRAGVSRRNATEIHLDGRCGAAMSESRDCWLSLNAGKKLLSSRVRSAKAQASVSTTSIRPFMFQAHPAYRTQIEIFRAAVGSAMLPVFPSDGIEHERWRPNSGTLRLLRAWRATRLPADAMDTYAYISGSFPPARHGLLGRFKRTHIDADDPLTLFLGGARGRLPGDRFRRLALALCERLGEVTLSFWSRTQLAAFLGNLRADESRAALAGGLLSVLPPAILPRVLRSSVGKRGTLRCLAVASGKFWHKGVPEILVAVDRLASKGLPVQLSLVGADIPADWMGWIARRPFITRFEQVPRPTLEGLFADHDLLLFPSHHDTFGWVLLEAKSYGVPALATSAYNRAEIVAHGVDGLLLADPFENPFLPVDQVPYAASYIAVSAGGSVTVSPMIEGFIEELTATLQRLLDDHGLLVALAAGALASVQTGGRFSCESRQAFLRSRLCR
jgi:glycosyltransferase involved in cell wall biosynthesis